MPKRARDNSELRFSDIASVNPRTPLNGLDPDAPVSFIPMADVDDGGRWVTRQTRPLREVKTGYSPFADGDTLFAKITPCTENGKGCHALDLVNGMGFGSTEFHVLRAKKGTDPRLVFHLAQSSDVRWKAAAVMDGSAGQQRVPADFFKICRIAPDILDNQDAKCDLFDAVDAAIDATRGVIEQTRRLKTAVLQDLLTRGLPGRHSEFREVKGLGQVPRAWKCMPLSKAVSYWQYGLSESLSDSGAYPCFRMNNYRNGRMVASDLKYIDLSDKALGTYRLERGDILFNRTNSRDLVGKIGIFDLDGDYVFASYLVRLRANPSIARPEFLNLLLNTAVNQERIRRLATPGVSQSNINVESLKQFRVALPSTDEQDTMIEFIAGLDDRRDREIETQRQLVDLKTALSQALLTGRVRVPAAKGVPVAS